MLARIWRNWNPLYTVGETVKQYFPLITLKMFLLFLLLFIFTDGKTPVHMITYSDPGSFTFDSSYESLSSIFYSFCYDLHLFFPLWICCGLPSKKLCSFSQLSFSSMLSLHQSLSIFFLQKFSFFKASYYLFHSLT